MRYFTIGMLFYYHFFGLLIAPIIEYFFCYEYVGYYFAFEWRMDVKIFKI